MGEGSGGWTVTVTGILGSLISSTALLDPGKIWSWGHFSPGIFAKSQVNDKGD